MTCGNAEDFLVAVAGRIGPDGCLPEGIDTADHAVKAQMDELRRRWS